MANEATLYIETKIPIPFTVADGASITKGTPLVMSDPMTAAAVATGLSGSICAGIASTDKIANDGVTKLGVFREGYFKVYASGALSVGDPLVNWGNFFSVAAINAENIWGTALETATHGETFYMQLNPTTMQLA